MTHNFVILFFCLAAPLVAQLSFATPHYYADKRERLNDYVFRTYTDPARLCWLLVDSAKDTWYKDPHQWDRSAESYSYRVASGWGRRVVKNTVQLGFETALHEDSRYRPSNERGLRKRVLFAVSHSVLAYKPDGAVEPAYGRLAAGVVTAVISSTWHPQSVRPGTLLGGIGQCALDRAGNNLLTEFEPDLKYFGRKTWNQVFRK
ncbi:MAG: hypothetical protein JWO80_1765 [Bryobacterales bacterium]|nr:hypothetical protein [Bryobacterales bacterium]